MDNLFLFIKWKSAITSVLHTWKHNKIDGEIEGTGPFLSDMTFYEEKYVAEGI